MVNVGASIERVISTWNQLSKAGTLMDDTDRGDAELVRRRAETRFEIGFERLRLGTAGCLQ